MLHLFNLLLCYVSLFDFYRRIFPNLVGIAADPVHPVFWLDAATKKHKTKAGGKYRAIMKKFTAFNPAVNPDGWGPVYQGDDSAPPLLCPL